MNNSFPHPYTKLNEKWASVLDNEKYPEMTDRSRRYATASSLHNLISETATRDTAEGEKIFSFTKTIEEAEGFNLFEEMKEVLSETSEVLSEAPVNATGSAIDNYDPVLVSMVRRALPNLMAYDVCGVQPMSGPVGLIFALRSHFDEQTGKEALFNEDRITQQTGSGVGAGNNYPVTGATLTQGAGETPDEFTARRAAWTTLYGGTLAESSGVYTWTAPASPTNPGAAQTGTNPVDGDYTTGRGVSTAAGEAFGDELDFPEMAMSIDKITVTATSRKIRTEYTIEVAQDIKAIHGLDIDSELSQILTQTLLFGINREVIRTIYQVAKTGAQTTQTPGTIDMNDDTDGRHLVEKFKGLLFLIQRDCNYIAQDTRRGRGNFLIVSADVAAALSSAEVLDYTPALNTKNVHSDDTGNTFAGTIYGMIKVYIDPYSANFGAQNQFYVAGYKGSLSYDAGLYYCPYIPIQMIRAIEPGKMTPNVGMLTRYGLVANPFVRTNGQTSSNDAPDESKYTPGSNQYYRKVAIKNL